MPIVEQIWTYERLLAEFPAESRVELIHNEIYMPPAPSLEHQETVSELGFLLQSFVRNGVLGKVFYAPFDVLLDANTVVQPDIVFVRKTNLQVLTQRGCEGIPNLVVEIISPSTFYRDSVEKFELYERYGVEEYWLVEPANQVIEVFRLVNGKYKLHSFVSCEEGEVAKSAILQGFEVRREEVFPKKN